MEEQQSLQWRRRNNNRAYSPTVLHEVLAWCLSLCWGKQSGAVCARTPACIVSECGGAHLWLKPWTGPPCGCRRRRVRQLLRQPHPHSSEHDGAPATDGPRISLSARCMHGGTQRKGCCRPHPSCGWLELGPWGRPVPVARSIYLRHYHY